MAFSKWDMVAWDQDGNPTKGSLVTPHGVEVEIYKNWVYVQENASAAVPTKNFYSRGIVMEICSGELYYKHVQIVAHRHRRQKAIFVAASYGYPAQFGGDAYGALFGIGYYRFMNRKFIGITPELVDSFVAWLKRLNGKSYTTTFFVPTIASDTQR